MAAEALAPTPTRERFVETTLALIAETGGSRDVNLREISRRLGYAHTNLYNYYPTYQDLLWEAFRRTLIAYGEHIVVGLDDSLAPGEYLRRLITNLGSFPEEQPGLYRFIASDPINIDEIPDDILNAVGHMKSWLTETFNAISGVETAAGSQAASDIVLSYIDGETLNLINGRVVPGEDVRGRIVENALLLFGLLTGNGIRTNPRTPPDRAVPRYPPLKVFGESLMGD
jgi:AcrR family transcriptional regulator